MKRDVPRETSFLSIPCFSDRDELDITSPAIQTITESLSLELEDAVLKQLVDYALLLRELNREINLVSRPNVDRVVLHSFYECLSLLPHIPELPGGKVLDVGTGGGFPGMLLAFFRPDLEFTLLDSRRAKVLALRLLQTELSLSNVDIIHDRAEIFAEHSKHHFDLITARSVGVIHEIIGWVEPLMAEGGFFVTWKGPEGLREFKRLKQENYSLYKRFPIHSHRSILIIRKEFTGGVEPAI